MISRRSFALSAGCFGAVISLPAPLAAARPGVDVRRFGARGDGEANDTAAFAAALAAAPAIHVPRGTYRVDTIVVPANRTIATDGFATVFHQRRGLGDGVRLICIVGSNVRLGDCTVRGNISADAGEQHHGVFLEASRDTGDIANVAIGNVRGENLRGDVVCLSTRDGRSASDIRVGNVHGSNILRNIVSIVGGRRIAVGTITGSRIGYTHLDIEPDDYNGPVVGCRVTAVHGGFVQIAGQTAAAAVDRARIGLLDLAAPVPRSTPLYKPGLSRTDALVIRNVRSLEIGRLVARGFAGQAIRQVWDTGALTDQRVHVATAELSDCARGARSIPAFVVGDRRATNLVIDSLAVEGLRVGMAVVRDCKTARIGAVHGKLPAGARLLAQSWSPPFGDLAPPGAGAVIGYARVSDLPELPLRA